MNRIQLVFIALLFASCGNNEVISYYTKASEVYGLASVIQLAGEETEIILQDYFMDVTRIDSIVAPSNFDVFMSADKKKVRLISQNGTIAKLSELKVWSNGGCYSLLMRKSRKLPVEITFKPQGKQPKTVQLAGQINDWNPAKTNLQNENGEWKTSLLLNPDRKSVV